MSARTVTRRSNLRRRRRRERIAGVAAEVVAGLVTLGVLAGLLSGGEYPWVIATYLRWAHLLLICAATGVLARLRWWRSAIAFSVVAAGVVTSVIVPLVALRAADPADRETLRIAVFNTGADNDDVTAMASAIHDAAPDVAVLLESEDVAAELDGALTGLSRLPVRPVAGVAPAPVVLAREPWPVTVEPLAGTRPATIVAAQIDDQPVEVVAFHPLPPISRRWADSHDRAVEALTGAVLPRRVPHVLACDCNSTPWTPSMRRLLATGLRGPTVTPTFGAPIVGTPTDHVLLSDRIDAVERTVGPFAGSDHRLIVTEIVLAR